MCLRTLHFEKTRSSFEEGEKLLQTLADAEFDTLEELVIHTERDWFAGGRNELIAPLLAFIGRQKGLKTLVMMFNGMNAEQIIEIRQFMEENLP